jgi:hypothetical protein
MLSLNWLRWRCTKPRILHQAERLLDEHGEAALLRAREDASRAQDLDRRWEARFWQSVEREIVRRLARARLIANMLKRSKGCAAKTQALADAKDGRPEAAQAGEDAAAWVADIQSRPLTIPDIPPISADPGRR